MAAEGFSFSSRDVLEGHLRDAMLENPGPEELARLQSDERAAAVADYLCSNFDSARQLFDRRLEELVEVAPTEGLLDL
ncbi:MAG: hypothetical protein AAF531_24020 [Actinomycetota bacterium]